MKKMLYILNIANRVNNFSYTSMKAAQDLGIEYHIAGNWNYANDQERIEDEKKYGIHIYQIDFIRNPYHPGNIKAYKQLKKIVEKERFDVIHCNTPIGGVVGRILGKSCKVPRVIYQAHGFHFYDGSPILNWFVYYPIERFLARYTDVLITINHEDYERAKSFKLRNHGSVYYVPGVGIQVNDFLTEYVDVSKKREDLGVPKNAILLISVGELNKNKNINTVIEALRIIDDENIHYLICGEGPMLEYLKELSAPITRRIHFLGYRNDIKELLAASDIFVLSSFREGLSRSLMEAMVVGLPCIVSGIRGNVDLIEDKELLCDSKNPDSFAQAIVLLSKDRIIRNRIGCKNAERVKAYSTEVVEDSILKIYKEIFI